MTCGNLSLKNTDSLSSLYHLPNLKESCAMKIETNEDEETQCLSFAYCHEDGCNWNPDTAEFELEYEQILVSYKVIDTLIDPTPRTCSSHTIILLYCQNILRTCLIVILKQARSLSFGLAASFLLIMTCLFSPLVF